MSITEIVLLVSILSVAVCILAYGISAIQNVSEYMSTQEKIFIYSLLSALVIVTIVLMSAIMQLDEVIEFDAHVERIISDTDYSAGTEEYIDNIESGCRDIEEIDVSGIMEITKEDCIERVFEHTPERYMFLNGVTP